MSTAAEIQAMMAEVAPTFKAIQRALESRMSDLLNYGASIALGREVSAKRARKLRRRGEDVRYLGTTKTGRFRYCWMRRDDPLSIYLE